MSHQGIFSLLDICFFFALINSLKGMSLTSDNIFAKGAVDRHPNVHFNSKYYCLWLIQSILSSIFSVWTTYTEMRISNTSSSLFNMMEKYCGHLVACTQCSVHLTQHTFPSMYRDVHLTLKAGRTEVGF